jgi:4-oxalocrotonate tautomerase
VRGGGAAFSLKGRGHKVSFEETEDDMPYVNVKITPDGATREKKEQIIGGVTKLLVDLLGKDPATTFVVIDVVDTEDWGYGGTSVRNRRAT